MNPFTWQGTPAEMLKPQRMTRIQSQLQPRRLDMSKTKEQEILRDRFGGAYSKATQGAGK